MKNFLFMVALVISCSAMGQKFSVKRLEIVGDKVNLYYDLVDTTAGRTYTISLLSSKDNFISPLQKVTGDIGLEVKPGRNKRITWNAREELGATFEGKQSLEVRGRLYVPFVRLDDLNKTFKRLRPTAITWTGGTQQNILNFDLYRGEEKIHSFINIANVGHYTLTIPVTVKPGKEYRLKITDTRNKDQIVFSPTFTIVRNIPLLLKAVPIGLVGAGIIYLATLHDKPPNYIPDPITP